MEDLIEFDDWHLYELGRDYLHRINAYSDTDRNYRMTYGDQWEGLKANGIEKVQYNFIEPIVAYKTSSINQNLWAINFSSENFDNRDFKKTADETCTMLNRKAAQVWEKDKLDHKLRLVCEDACINDEGIMYAFYDEETQAPLNEILNKVDVMYGNENSSDIQSQPYILVRKRVPVGNAKDLAILYGCTKNEVDKVVPDNFKIMEETGTDSKVEVNNGDDKVTILTKFWKEGGIVFYRVSTRYCELKKATSMGMKLYPIAHMLWREKKGSARGEGEVRYLIPNQLELNKTLMRMLLTVKNTAFPQKIVNRSKLTNPEAINNTGGIIYYDGIEVDDVRKMFATTTPAQMSSDVTRTISDLISITRQLKNASDIATGSINPEQASGKAILAVQEASKQPLVIQTSALKQFVEDIARIWMDMWITYTQDGIQLEQEITDGVSGDTYYEIVTVPPTVMEKIKANVKIDTTPTGAYDRYAQELSLENLLKGGYFNIQNVSQLKLYAEALPDNSVMPKQKLLDIVEKMEEEQQKIAMIEAQMNIMKQRANTFLDMPVDAQAGVVNNAAQQIGG